MTAPLRRPEISGCSEDSATQPASTSRSDLLDKGLSSVLKRMPIDARDFDRWFPEAFSRWLRQNFHSTEQVAAAFRVRNSTAHYWWHGSHGARGATVGLVFMTFPSALAWFLREWEDR